MSRGSAPAHLRLEWWLMARSLSRVWLADRCCCTPGAVTRWLTGDIVPSRIYRREIERITEGVILASDWSSDE